MLVLDYLQMKEASLPVRYLGVPLISKKLSATNCSILIEKVSGRNNSWISKKLSVGDKSHSTRSKEESNKVQTDKVISDQKSKKISN
jgi:hypothetical protein